MRKNYLDLPKNERQLLSAEWWERNGRPQKAEKDNEQPPLPFGDGERLVKPYGRCNFCPWESGSLTHNDIIRTRAFGCPDCGTRPVSIVDLWE